MRKRGVRIVGGFVGLGLALWCVSRVDAASMVINEIMAYPTTPAEEWIELYNASTNPIDLTGWVFYENATRHGLKAVGTPIVPGGSYAIIAENSTTFAGKYPTITAPVFDSSWSTGLSGSGEMIGLKDASDQFVEQFAFPASTHGSLERISALADPALAQSWVERTSGSSVGSVNSVYVENVQSNVSTTGTASTSANATTSVEVNSPVTSTISNTTSSLAVWDGLVINEALPWPTSGTEWVELYNMTNNSIDLAQGVLCDNRTTSCTIANLSGIIAPHGFLVVPISGSKLNNDGDSIVLKDPSGKILDQITYGVDGLMPAAEQVIARTSDGAGSWAISIGATMGAANRIVEPIKTTVNSGSNVSSVQHTDTEDASNENDLPLIASVNGSQGIVWYASSSPLSITEVFPNPEGDDARSEFIEITNTSNDDVAIDGWRLWVDGAVFDLSGRIPDGDTMVWYRSVTHLELRNTSSSLIRLIDPDLVIRDELRYPVPVVRGQSYARLARALWQWQKPTPKTIPTEPSSITILQPNVPVFVAKNEAFIASVARNPDPRGGTWRAVWTWCGTRYEGTTVTLIGTIDGECELRVEATSTMGTVGRGSRMVTVRNDGSISSGQIRLNEVYAQPDAVEDISEFIELINDDVHPVRLDGWSMVAHSGKKYVIPENTVLDPQDLVVFYGSTTGITLGNTGDTIRLYDAGMRLVDHVEVPRVQEGTTFERRADVWHNTLLPSPGENGTSAVVVLKKTSKISPTSTIDKKKNTSIAIKKTVNKKTSLSVRSNDISRIYALRKGARTSIEGTVVAKPGQFGAQYMAIADTSSGIMVYQSKKDFPALDIGDLVRVVGTVSETSGRKRLNVARASDINTLSTDNTVDPIERTIESLSVKDVGRLVQIQGDLTSKNSAKAFLDNGTAEVPVIIKSGAHIATKTWKIGTAYRMTGVVVPTATGVEVWLRQPSDVEAVGITSTPTSSLKVEQIETLSSKPSSAVPIYPVIVGGLVALNGALLWRLYKKNSLS